MNWLIEFLLDGGAKKICRIIGISILLFILTDGFKNIKMNHWKSSLIGVSIGLIA